MKTKNSCYTYFKIVGEFDPQEISNILGLNAEKSWRIGDTYIDGSKYEFALWEIGRCNDYDVEVANQMRKTLSLLMDKVDLLNKIRQQNDFCHATRTEIDIDLYVLDSSDENE